MRRTFFAALFALSACATVPSGLPQLHYADAASRGAFSAFLAGRPNQRQVDQVTENWSNTLSDSAACGVRMRSVIDAGLVGALEIGAMNAAASGGGQREVREGVERYVGSLAGLFTSHRDRPSPERCSTLADWAPRTADAGREAVHRARANGLMDNDYGILLDLLAH